MPIRPAVYIETNKPNGILYTGVSGNLAQRHTQHTTGTGSSFTAKYKIDKLIWYEFHPTMAAAIARETQLKNWSRAAKVALILQTNPTWQNLSSHLQDL